MSLKYNCKKILCVNILLVYHRTRQESLVVSRDLIPSLQQHLAKDPVGDRRPAWTDGKLNDLIKCLELISSSCTPT